MVKDGGFSHIKDYVPFFVEILNIEGHVNCVIGLKVIAILVNRRILPSCGVALERVCAYSLHSRFGD